MAGSDALASATMLLNRPPAGGLEAHREWRLMLAAVGALVASHAAGMDDEDDEEVDETSRFISNLVPNSDRPHPLSTKLRRFVLNQKSTTFHNGALFDQEMVAAMHAALVRNSTLEYVAFTVDRDDEMAKEYPLQFKDQIGRPVRASRDKRSTDIVKARQWAFLSVVQATTPTKAAPSALHLLDAADDEVYWLLKENAINPTIGQSRTNSDRYFEEEGRA